MVTFCHSEGDNLLLGPVPRAYPAWAMKILAVLLLFFSGSAWASQPCVITYSIIRTDTLGNVNEGVSGKTLKWLTKDLEKKYPGVCYTAPDPSVTTVLVIMAVPETYHGTRVVTTQGDTSGRITDSDGDTANYTGTNSTSTAVPYSFAYGRFTLTVETYVNGKATAHHRFQQDGIYNTMYGIPLGGRGHHPQKALIEDAVKWLSSGGLNDPLQRVQ
jgi:hypothetical protein